jgi:hypothetical protein
LWSEKKILKVVRYNPFLTRVENLIFVSPTGDVIHGAWVFDAKWARSHEGSFFKCRGI